MSDAGKLCSKTETGELCYSAKTQYTSGNRPLVYKAPEVHGDAMTIAFSFSKFEWECQTYHATHEGAIDVVTLWDNKTYDSQVGAFKIGVGSAYASVMRELKLTIAARDLCAAHEDPGIDCAVMVTAGDRTEVAGPFPCPLGVGGAARTVTILIENGELAGITSEA